MGLHHGGVAVDVHHQAWQEVTLAMHEAEAVVVLADKPEAPAQGEGAQQPAVIEIGRKRIGREFKYPHRDASYLVMSRAEHGAL